MPETLILPDLTQRGARYERIERELRALHVDGAVQPIDFRDGEDGAPPEIQGYAAVFDVWYEVHDMFGPYQEQVRTGAFNVTLAQGADVRLLLNHEGAPFARTKSGTLDLTVDGVGLHYGSKLDPEDPDVRALVPKMRRGDLAESSMAFSTIRQEWNADYTERSLLELKLYDVSVVTFPASPTTSSAIRGADLLVAIAAMDPEQLDTELRSAGGTIDTELVSRAQSVLNALASRGALEPAPTAEEGAQEDVTGDEAGERDEGRTMTLDMAKRYAEIAELGGH